MKGRTHTYQTRVNASNGKDNKLLCGAKDKIIIMLRRMIAASTEKITNISDTFLNVKQNNYRTEGDAATYCRHFE